MPIELVDRSRELLRQAYDALAKENEELKAKYDGVFNQRMRFAQEITSLRESLKLAVETIEKALTYKNGICTTPTQDLEDNLAKIKAKHGEL